MFNIGTESNGSADLDSQTDIICNIFDMVDQHGLSETIRNFIVEDEVLRDVVDLNCREDALISLEEVLLALEKKKYAQTSKDRSDESRSMKGHDYGHEASGWKKQSAADRADERKSMIGKHFGHEGYADMKKQSAKSRADESRGMRGDDYAHEKKYNESAKAREDDARGLDKYYGKEGYADMKKQSAKSRADESRSMKGHDYGHEAYKKQSAKDRADERRSMLGKRF